MRVQIGGFQLDPVQTGLIWVPTAALLYVINGAIIPFFYSDELFISSLVLVVHEVLGLLEIIVEFFLSQLKIDRGLGRVLPMNSIKSFFFCQCILTIFRFSF